MVFLDVKMAGLDGLETLARLRALDPQAVVVMISGHGTIATAVEATQRGAFDFLEKPLDTDRLLLTVRNALAHAELVGENARLREAAGSRYQMVGSSPAMGPSSTLTSSWFVMVRTVRRPLARRFDRTHQPRGRSRGQDGPRAPGRPGFRAVQTRPCRWA